MKSKSLEKNIAFNDMSFRSFLKDLEKLCCVQKNLNYKVKVKDKIFSRRKKTYVFFSFNSLDPGLCVL